MFESTQQLESYFCVKSILNLEELRITIEEEKNLSHCDLPRATFLNSMLKCCSMFGVKLLN